MVTFDVLDRQRKKLAENGGKVYDDLLSQAATVRTRLIESLRGDPLIREFVRGHMDRQPVTRPIEVLGEQRLQAFFAANQGADHIPLAVEGHDIGNNADYKAVSLAMTVLSATPFYWSNQMIKTAVASPLPPHVISRELLPFPLMYWCFETAYSDLRGDDYWWDAHLIADVGGGANVFQFGTRGGAWLVEVAGFKYGDRYPDDVPDLEPLLQMLSFMRSPYVSSAPERVRRAERRAVTRKNPDAVVPDVCVIKLRTPHGQHKDDKREVDIGRGYSHRFMVRGHHRAQWYPSLQAHKVIWIAPYIKGDPDKPFHEPVYAVVR